MRRLLALLLLSCAAAAGCTKAQAKTPVAPPALVTPTPPDRVIVPAPMPEAVDPPAAPAPPPTTPARPNPPAPTPRPSTPTTAPAPPPAAAAEPTPPPVLQTTSNPGEVEQKARTLLSAAQRDLDLINPAQLTANARAQYDTARAFVKQADNALKVRNVVLARELADKAAALASQLRR